jgi:hypothetical protein
MPHRPHLGDAFDRRRFLKGVGASVAIPAFRSIVPDNSTFAAASLAAPATTATGAPLRMAFMSIPNGVQQDHWFPAGEGKAFSLSATMKSLEPVKQHLQVISGLKHENATAGNDGAGDHARANATFLTAARARKTAGKDINVGISVDQVAAQTLGHVTRFPSLELSCDAIRNSGSCDSGYACAYQYNLAWTSPTTPLTPEPNPRFVFERLFGTGKYGDRQRSLALRQQTQRSVLDFVLEDAASVQKELGEQDRRKLDEYLTGVRSIEKRIQSAERFGKTPDPEIDTPNGIPGNFGQHMEVMYDLMVLAFQTDSTRIATLLLSYDGSNRTFPDLGITEGHHYLTHNQRKENVAEKVAAIDRYYMQHFANFIGKLSQTKDVDDNSLLHNSMIVYGGAIADGNRHTHNNLPVILAGTAGGAFETGRFLQLDEAPMANLFVSMLNQFGAKTDKFGDSTGNVDSPLLRTA